MATAKNPATRPDIVTLAGLAPAQDVNGGARRAVFGAQPVAKPP